jgi:hypothetical protein
LIAFDLAQALTEPEAQFRLVVAVGTAVYGNKLLIGLARSLDLTAFLAICQQSESEKLRLAAQHLLQLL